LAADNDESSDSLEEVLVTARKISENIQDVPVAITAVSANLIDILDIRSLADISKITAGLNFDSEFGRGANRPVIRGQANILGSSGVSYFIDGVYINASIDDYDINDVERVEVVKGPQSALYGRNTYSGAINIITRSPGREMSGRALVKVAQDDEYEVSATLRGPLSENMSFGLTGRYFDRGGPFTNTWDDSEIGKQESKSVSGVLEFKDERLRIRARVYSGRTYDGQAAIFATRTADNNCYFDNGSIYNGRGRYFCGVVKPGPINVDWPLQAPRAKQTENSLQSSLLIDYEFDDNWSLTSITGYNEHDGVMITDGDYLPTRFQVSNFTPNGFPYAGFADGPPFFYGYVGSMIDFTFANASDADDWSQELRINFSGDNFEGLFGAYYFDSESTTQDIRELPANGQSDADANWFAEFMRMQGVCAANPFCESMAPFFGSTVIVPRNVNSLDIRNQALYGMISFDLSDAFGLTVEGRYQEEKITQNAIVQDLGGPVVATSTASETFKKFSPRVTLDWTPADNSMLYLLYAEGTKPGGFNSVVAIEAGLPTFDEEKVKSFELGSKNVFADGQVVANFAAYFNKVDGYQLTQLAQTETQTTTATVNAGDAEVKGLEAELMIRPAVAEGLTLTLNYAWNDSKFTRGVDQNQGVLDDVLDDGLVNCSTGDEFPNDSSCTSKFGSIEGHRIPRSPKHQAYIDVDFTQPFGSAGWNWFVGANYSYESTKFAQVHNLAETGSTTLVNARLGVRNDNWMVQLYGRNLTGEDSAPQVLRYAEPYAFTRNFAVSQRRDTFWGFRASYEF